MCPATVPGQRSGGSARRFGSNPGLERGPKTVTPRLWPEKQATGQLAQELGGAALVELIRTDTHTCYRGERGMLHDWGHGCGQCPACELRARGWRQFAAQAPAL